jgi:hypothetical protein
VAQRYHKNSNRSHPWEHGKTKTAGYDICTCVGPSICETSRSCDDLQLLSHKHPMTYIYLHNTLVTTGVHQQRPQCGRLRLSPIELVTGTMSIHSFHIMYLLQYCNKYEIYIRLRLTNKIQYPPKYQPRSVISSTTNQGSSARPAFTVMLLVNQV